MNHFFEQLLTFMTELSEMYPDDPDFPVGITSVRMVKIANPGMGPIMFYDSTKAFEFEILSKNEKFFLDHSFGEFGSYVDFNLLGKLKQYVSTMSPASKDTAWTYIQNLYKLSKALTPHT